VATTERALPCALVSGTQDAESPSLARGDGGVLKRARTILVGAGQRLRESFAGRELALERRTSTRYLQRAEHQLGADAWSTARRRGAELPLDVVIGLALTSD
jgi:hypothetical protein